MSIFRVFHLRHLRRQPLRTLLAAVALAAAVATSVVSVVVINSLDRSTEALLESLAGPAPLRVVGPLTRGGVAPSTLDVAAATEGVQTAVPAVQGVVFAQNDEGLRKSVLVVGVDCRAEALFGTFGCDTELVDEASNQPVVISAALARELGEGGYLRTDMGRIPLAGVVRNDQLDDANGGGVVLYGLSAAQRILDRGNNLDAVYIKPEANADLRALQTRLVRAVGEHNMVLRRDEPSAWLLTKGPLIPLLGFTVLIALGLSSLLVYNIVALSLAERRRDIAIVSAVGSSPSMTTRNILGESAVLGFIGGIGGIGAGAAAAHPMVRSIASVVTEQASGMRVDVHIPASAYVIAIVLGVATSVVASLIPARRASRIDLAAELHGRGGLLEAAPRRTVWRIAVLALGTAFAVVLSILAQRDGALEPWQPLAGGIALMLSGFVSFALAGALAPMLLGAVLARLRSRGGSSRVSLANLVSQPRRTSVIAAAVASAVGMGCVLGSLIPAIKGAVSTYDGGSISGLVFVTTLPLNNSSNVDARLPHGSLARIVRLDGVASVAETRIAEVSDQHGTYGLVGLEGLHEPSPVVMGDDVEDVLARGDAVVATGTARARNLRPGDVMRIATPTGFRRVDVGAIWSFARDNGHSVTVSLDRFENLVGRPTPHSVLLTPQDGVSAAELARRVGAAGIDPDLTVLSDTELSTAMADEVGLQVEPFWLMQRLLLFVALVGTLSTLLLIGVQRRRELGILGAVGFAPSRLGRMTLLEAVAAGGVGALLGAIASTAVFETLRNSAATAVGARPPFHFAFGAAVSSIALALVVVAIGGAWPAWRTSRLQIVEAIRDE